MGKTEDNLAEAFAGESMARNKYTYFAKVARKEGYHYIAKIFEETAENEVRHAKDEYQMLHGLGDTADCLKRLMRVRIMKYRLCTKTSRKKLMRRATKKQQIFSGRLPR